MLRDYQETLLEHHNLNFSRTVRQFAFLKLIFKALLARKFSKSNDFQALSKPV